VKRLCATVLIMEAIVLGLSIPVAVQIDHLAPHAAGLTGGVAAVVTLAGGSLLQVFVIASGAVVPAMYFLGGIFAALWTIGIWLGYRVEHAAGH
jgi:hypothetical protein